MNDNAKRLLARFEPKESKILTADPQVVSARYSPCGEFLVAGGFDGRVRRWRMNDDDVAEWSSLGVHNGWVEALAFHGDTLFSADTWGRICAWRCAVERPSPNWSINEAHDGWIRQLAVSPDGNTLASCGRDQMIRLWSVFDGKPLGEISGHQEDVFCVRFHPAGRSLVGGDGKGFVKQWDASTGDLIRTFDASALFLYHRIQEVGGVRAITFDDSGDTLAVGGVTPKNGGAIQGAPTVLLFDFDTGVLQTTMNLGAASDCFVHDIHLHPAGFVMAVTSGTPGNGRLVFQQPNAKEPFFMAKKMVNCHSLSVHPDGRRLAVTATNKGSNGNGRRLTKDGQYAGNQSPIHLLRMGS